MGAVGTWARILPQAPGEAQPREESESLCGGWKGCVCVCVCACAHTCACAYARDENEILGYFLIHHPARQESHIASGLGVSRLVKKVKPEFRSVSVYVQTNLLLLCFTFLHFTDIGDFSFFPY